MSSSRDRKPKKDILNSTVRKAVECETHPIQGPKKLKQSTKNLERLFTKIIDPDSGVKFKHDMSGNLFAEWTEKGTDQELDVTEIFSHAPNYQHIHLTDTQLVAAMDHVISKSNFIVSASSTDEKFYSKREKDYKFAAKDLHLVEKIAINIYTSSDYRKLNNFLNHFGKNEAKLSELFGSYKNYLNNIGATIALIVIASHGLDKLPSSNKILFREENTQTLKEKVAAVTEGKIIPINSFLSTSDIEADSSFSAMDASLFSLIAAESGKDVRVYAIKPTESEILLPPGTPLKYVGHYTESENHYLGIREEMGIIPEKDIPTKSKDYKIYSPTKNIGTLFGKSIQKKTLAETLDEISIDNLLKLKNLSGKEFEEAWVILLSDILNKHDVSILKSQKIKPEQAPYLTVMLLNLLKKEKLFDLTYLIPLQLPLEVKIKNILVGLEALKQQKKITPE